MFSKHDSGDSFMSGSYSGADLHGIPFGSRAAQDGGAA